jgi:Fur family ferric uptake transcriptional regulator
MNKDSCRLMLTEKGLKNTKTRALVLQILDQATNPMTVDEIFLEMKKNDSSINLSTVYRTLETLLKKAFVVKTNLMEDSRSRYELNRMEH